MKKPKISVIIPEYNYPKFLFYTLDSLQKQSFKDYETILVDDYSVKKPSFNLNIIKNKRLKGPAGARNTGILNARADIIAFIDSDCYADKDWLKNIYKNVKQESILMGKIKIPKSSLLGDSISMLGFPAGGNLGFENVWKVDKENYTDHISSCNFAIKKSLFKKYGLFDESFPIAGAEDSEFSWRLNQKGEKIKYCEDMLVWHEPRKTLISFIKWQIYRGRSNYYFEKKVKNVNKFIKLRVWYAKNVIFKNLFNFKIFIIIPLLFLSLICQQIGYIQEKIKNDK